MNMNKKIITLLLIFSSFFILNLNSYATTTTTTTTTQPATTTAFQKTTTTVVSCNNLTTQNECSAAGQGKCRWISGSCQAQYVAQEPCNDNNIRTVLKICGYVILVAKLIIPLIIIGYGIIDMYKSVIDKDEKSLSKQGKRFLLRVVTGLIIFFIPNLINAIFSLSDTLNIISTEEYKTCAACVLDPLDTSKCNTTDVLENNQTNTN